MYLEVLINIEAGSFLIIKSAGQEPKLHLSILSHGFVVDGKGMKMSKSMGNEYQKIFEKYGLIFKGMGII